MPRYTELPRAASVELNAAKRPICSTSPLVQWYRHRYLSGMKSSLARAITVSLSAAVVCAAVAVAPPAQAYPPGTALSVATSAATVKIGSSITVTAAHAVYYPASNNTKCVVTFTADGLASKAVTATTAGAASTTFTWGTAQGGGTKHITASTTAGRCGGESAGTNITVYTTPTTPSAPSGTSSASGVANGSKYIDVSWTAVSTGLASGWVPASSYTAYLYTTATTTTVTVRTSVSRGRTTVTTTTSTSSATTTKTGQNTVSPYRFTGLSKGSGPTVTGSVGNTTTRTVVNTFQVARTVTNSMGLTSAISAKTSVTLL